MPVTGHAGRLDGTVMIVTGAGSGIGAATAFRAASEGASVVVADLSGRRADGTVVAISTDGGEATAVKADLSTADGAAACVDAAVSSYGRLDSLVNNVGMVVPGTVESVPVDAWDMIFGVNVRSGYLCSRFAIPHLRAAGGGSISFTASVDAHAPTHNAAAYAATKAAVVGLVRSMAVDHGMDGIRVNAVCPALTSTPPVVAIVGEAELARRAKTIPLGQRVATPEEVAAVFVFLASDDARFISGQSIVVDGAQTAGFFNPAEPERATSPG